MKARRVRDELISTDHKTVLLQGDLHHDNILKNGDSWVVIDPKRFIGDSVYEVAAFIRNPIPDLLSSDGVLDIVNNRIISFAKILGYQNSRIINWCFVQAVLFWA